MKRFLPLLFLVLLWAVPAGAASWLSETSKADDQPPPPAPESYHPGDVEVVNNILRATDRRSHLGWEPGRPETWPIHHVTQPPGLYFPGYQPLAGVRWSDEGRLTALFLPKRSLSGRLDVGGLSALEILRVEDNPNLEGIMGLESCAELAELNAGLNWPPGDDHFSRLTEISPLGGLKNLRILKLNRNRLTSLGDLSGLTQLTELNVSGSRLTGLGDLSGLTQLTKLNVSGNQLADIGDLSGLTQLTELNVSGNQLADIGDLGGLTQLAYLDVSGNHLADIGDLSGLTQLARLDVNGNQLTDLGDLSALRQLTSLIAADNRLAGLSLPQPGRFGLITLDVTNNRLSGLQGLSNLSNLQSLSLGGNPLLDLDFLTGAAVDQSQSSDFSSFYGYQPRSSDSGLFRADELRSFGFSGDQRPEFSLKWGLMRLRILRIGGGAELKSVDLAGRQLEQIVLDDHISADKFSNPGLVDKCLIRGDLHYRLTELMALADKLGSPLRSPRLEYSTKYMRDGGYTYIHARISTQTVTLNDAAAGLAAGRAYLPADLSPVLGEEYAAGGPETLIHLFPADQDGPA